MPKVYKSGKVVYSAAEVKESELPYLGRSKKYRGYEDIPGFVTFDECNKLGCSIPDDQEKPVQFRFHHNIGSNYYLPEYDRCQELRDYFIQKRLAEINRSEAKREKKITQNRTLFGLMKNCLYW
jgi:hypothetical protein